MNIAEIYQSRQGEGRLAGTPSVFVRTSGCNLRCWFCDTPFASWHPEGRDLPVDEIISSVLGWETRHVVLTGGEPMLFAELIPLCRQLSRLRRHVTIETAGTLFLPVDCDLISISPKLANSTPDPGAHSRWSQRHDRDRHRPDVVRQLIRRHDYQLKFVVDRPDDLEEIEQYLAELGPHDRQRVLLMPLGAEPQALAERETWLQPLCAARGLVYCPRRHIEWFGAERGT